MIIEIFTGIITIIVIFIFYIGIFLLVPTMIDERSKRRRRQVLGKLITTIHEKNPLTKRQIEILSEDYRLNHGDTQLILRRQFYEAIKRGDLSLMIYFEELYEELKRDEPFEGLPSDIRLHLHRIKESIGDNNNFLMQPLVTQLQDLNRINRKKAKWMWGLTIASFVAGVVGVIFGAIPYL